MSDRIIGEVVEIEVPIVDSSTGEPVDPSTLQFSYVSPAGLVTTKVAPDPSIDHPAIGLYVAHFTPTTVGRWRWRVETSGRGVGADQGFIDVAGEFADSITPEVSDVGAILNARTRDRKTARTLGTFTENTQPTGDEVADFIKHAADEVALQLPEDLQGTRLVPFARRLVAIRAAMAIEVSYDPDRDEGGSAYPRLREQYEQGLAALQASVTQDTAQTTAFGSIRMRSVMTEDDWLC